MKPDYVFYDEVAEFTEEQWREIESILRKRSTVSAEKPPRPDTKPPSPGGTPHE